MKRSVTYGEERIGFSIHFVSRVARRVAIHVHPDGSVQVDAPPDLDVDTVVAAVRRRARWIWLRLCAYRDRMMHVLPRKYVSGESHFYLGKRYLLKVIYHLDEPQSVKLLRGRIEIRTRSREANRVRALLDGWYRDRAEAVFAGASQTA